MTLQLHVFNINEHKAVYANDTQIVNFILQYFSDNLSQ